MGKMKYEAGNESAIRKNEYMPCILCAEREDYTAEQWVKLMKRCYFVDNYTTAEWKAILDDNPKNAAVHKSKIKKKVAQLEENKKRYKENRNIRKRSKRDHYIQIKNKAFLKENRYIFSF